MMGSEAPKSSPNPNNVHHIGGIPVEFPYKPYGSQLAFMGRVISTLDRAKRQGHCHALLESPTGTGKSLSLLCSTLAWQHNYRTKNLYTNLSQSKPAPEAISDPLGHGGGFIPEMEPSGNLEPSSLEQTPGKLTKSQKKKAVPTIYYASRTHSQISQVIREYRKTAYRVPMAVLASRKNYCTNKSLCGKDNIDEECKMLLKDKEVGCFEFKNAHKVKGHPSFQKGGCSEAHDIEDLVKVGKAVKGCSYFAAHSFAEEAQLIFCPYNYIINPTIRRSMDVDIKGSIVILDEAHNIEDMARDAGSTEIEEDILFTLQMELQSLCLADSEIYQPLYDVIQGIIGWIGQRKDTLAKHDFQHYFSCWTGDKALRELQEIGISRQFFPILKECVTKAIKAASDAESGLPHLSGMSLMMLEGLFSSLGYFFSGDGRHTVDYQLVLQRYVKKESGRASTGWTHSLGLWCLNPAVVFREIADLSMSVILTSGTLSPMNTFSSELGVQFETCMEAPHVIDMESQVWAAAISTGPGNYPLNASYKMADNYGFQDALGASLEEICKIVPGGVLVFFPSYKLMDKLCARWHETGQWTRLNAQKSLFVEPKGSQDEFEHVLKGYYDTINHGRTASAWKIRKGKKRYVNHSDMEGTPEPSSKGGAAFLAVCRGKVSEGIDFADANARAVVIVGIPFPNINDIQVAQKKKFNDTYRSSKNLLSGSEWYCNQAFRALNQAAGRCIRHRFDYGAIILLDERYREERNMAHISKWLRRSIKHSNNFDMSIEGLHSFFQDVKERNGVVSENSVINEKNSPLMPKVSSKVCGRKKNQKGDKLDNPNGGRVLPESVSTAGKAGRFSDSMNSVGKHYAFPPKQKSKDNVGGLSFVQEDKKDVKNNRESIDLDCSPQRDTRWSEITSLASCNGSPELFVVKETPGLYSNTSMASSAVASNEENSNTKVVQASSEFSDQLSLHSTAAENSNAVLSMVTPKKLTDADFCNLKPEIESSLNLSVNSHMPKRRKPINLSLINSYQMDSLESLDAKCPLNIDHTIKKGVFGDANCRNELSFGADCIESECHQLHVPQMKLVNSSSIVSSCSGAVSDKSLNISCSLCRNSLGLPNNQFLVSCSLTSSSKVYMASFLKSELEDRFMSESASVPVVISDTSLVDQRLYTHLPGKGAENHGIWSEKDGCVFKTIFCPFCAVSNRFLGQQVMAADANNTHLLNKILFYLDRVVIKDVEASKVKAFTPVDDFVNGGAAQYSISSGLDDELISGSMGNNKVSYPSKRESSGGWRTTRSKLRLPKRALLRDTDEISM